MEDLEREIEIERVRKMEGVRKREEEECVRDRGREMRGCEGEGGGGACEGQREGDGRCEGEAEGDGGCKRKEMCKGGDGGCEGEGQQWCGTFIN